MSPLELRHRMEGANRQYVRALNDWRDALPHEAFWELMPLPAEYWPSPHGWHCYWHGLIASERCGECAREYAEYLETGTWEGRPDDRPERASAKRHRQLTGFSALPD